jgi:phosphoglycolate phosphatase
MVSAMNDIPTVISTVLFDLDGTLIDTAPDMAAALDILCDEQDHPRLAFENVRPVVSNGSVALVKLAFGDEVDDDKLERLKQRYLDIYQGNLANRSQLFNDMDELLLQLENRRMKWGVVTNKPGWLTEPLMQALNLDRRASCIVSADSTANRKPHPEPMFHACSLSGSLPEQCIYVGDARRDIEAGQNAGMKTVIASYGYIGDWEDMDDWRADYRIATPTQLLQYI